MATLWIPESRPHSPGTGPLDQQVRTAVGRSDDGLKSELEGTKMAGPKHVYVFYVRTTPEKLWKAITSTEFTKKHFGLSVESNWILSGPSAANRWRG